MLASKLRVAGVVGAVARLGRCAVKHGQVDRVATAGATGDYVHAASLVLDLVTVVPVEGEAA
jgi:hypothetical protein